MKKKKNFSEAAVFAGGGGLLGAGVASFIGNMGLVGGFGGIAIGSAPIVGAGTVVGMAVYGLKKLID